jgi:hypothetical protein
MRIGWIGWIGRGRGIGRLVDPAKREDPGNDDRVVVPCLPLSPVCLRHYGLSVPASPLNKHQWQRPLDAL